MVQDILGKKYFMYNPRGNRKYSHEDISKVLEKFCINESLRQIGLISKDIFDKAKPYPFMKLEGVPVCDANLTYIAMKLIENGSDDQSRAMSPRDIAKVADMWFGLPDPYEEDKNETECMMRMAASQFEYNLDWMHFLSRTACIYKKCWGLVTEDNNIDVLKEIENITGLTIDVVMALSYWFTLQGGHFPIYNSISIPNSDHSKVINAENQNKFLEWAASDYAHFREVSLEYKATFGQEIYKFDQFRFNPLNIFPLIKPSKDFSWSKEKIVLIPIHYLVLKRVTQGLYHDLSKQFEIPGEKGNKFRIIFGKVFEKYVGELLKNAKTPLNGISPFKYVKSKQTLESADWMILDDNRLILIEVKHNGLYLTSRITGDLISIRNDLSKSVAKGVKQLLKFEDNIKSGKCPALHYLEGKQTERLIVTYDQIYFANSVIDEQVKIILSDEGIKLPPDFHWHLISVEQFEQMLGNKNFNLFDYLKNKRLNPKYAAQDFREYLFYTGKTANNDYLPALYNEFFEELKFLPQPNTSEDDKLLTKLTPVDAKGLQYPTTPTPQPFTPSYRSKFEMKGRDRNKPCPCGSGKKYKKCCGEYD